MAWMACILSNSQIQHEYKVSTHYRVLKRTLMQHCFEVIGVSVRTCSETTKINS